MVRVLVVDDEAPIREVVVDALRSEGYSVDQAVNGADALRRLQSNRPDLLILDLMMPVLSGQAVIEIVRQDPSLARTPVIVLSALYDLPSTAPVLDVQACLPKPFDMNGLLDTVAHLVPPPAEPRALLGPS